jgi:hypothetical protein
VGASGKVDREYVIPAEESAGAVMTACFNDVELSTIETNGSTPGP